MIWYPCGVQPLWFHVYCEDSKECFLHNGEVLLWSWSFGSLYFPPLIMTMNGDRYCEVMKNHLFPFQETFYSQLLKHDSSPWHKRKTNVWGQRYWKLNWVWQLLRAHWEGMRLQEEAPNFIRRWLTTVLKLQQAIVT